MEYFDTRAAMKALKECRNLDLEGCTINAELSWDIGAKNLVKQERERKGNPRKPRSPDTPNYTTSSYNQRRLPPNNAAASMANVPSNLALQAILSAASPPQQQFQPQTPPQQQYNPLASLLQNIPQPPPQVSLNSNTNQQLQVLQQLYALQNHINATKK